MMLPCGTVLAYSLPTAPPLGTWSNRFSKFFGTHDCALVAGEPLFLGRFDGRRSKRDGHSGPVRRRTRRYRGDR